MSFWLPKLPNFVHFYQKWPILTKYAPLRSVFTKIMLINLTEMIFPYLYSEYFLTNFPKFWPMTLYWPQITQFWPFYQKWHNLTKMTPLMTLLTKFMAKPDRINFWKKIFVPPQNFDLWHHFGPQNDLNLTIFAKNDLFSSRMAYFDQIEPINDIFDHSYVNKSD